MSSLEGKQVDIVLYSFTQIKTALIIYFASYDHAQGK